MADKLAVNHVLLAISFGVIAPIVVCNHAAIAEESMYIPQRLVEPSLWWKSQRLEEGWVEGIAIDAETKNAIVTINLTRWTASDYLQRFSFLFKLGTEAQKQNFNVALHDRRDRKIAEYSTQAERWKIDPTSLGAEPFRVVAPTIYQQQF
jgi:hypothetical protein